MTRKKQNRSQELADKAAGRVAEAAGALKGDRTVPCKLSEATGSECRKE